MDHQTGSHPECPERLADFKDRHFADLPSGFDYLRLVHTPEHIAQVQQACVTGTSLDGDTLTSTGSYLAALDGVAASITASTTGGFALVRPPGHHAYPHNSTGFCLFNNIGIAAKHLTSQGKKVLIVDFDGHLGDGTSHIFYKDSQVLFCSLHQYPAFPGNGRVNEIGSGAGLGYTINIPMPAAAGDDLFWEAMQSILPIAHQFNPDVVAVSAGFDGHIMDPLLQLRYSLSTYYKCGQWLHEHFNEVFAVLEGGYNLDILPKAIWNFADGYNEKPQQYREDWTNSSPVVSKKFFADLSALKDILSPFWSF